MIVYNSTDMRRWGKVLREAQRDTIEVRSHGEPSAYIVGVEEYRELQAFKTAALEAKLSEAHDGIERGEVSEAQPHDIITRAKAR